MSFWDIAVICVIGACVVGTTARLVYLKVKKRGGCCGCDCSHCGGSCRNSANRPK